MKVFTLKYLGIFFLLCLTTWTVWNIFNRPLTGIDDANIYFVYAKNFAGGHGFVYNIGGEKVEGFTSLLWVLLCTLVFSVSEKPELTLLIINIAILAFGVTVALSYSQSALFSQENISYEKLLSSILFIAFLCMSPAYITWNTITLMENSIWSTLLLIATIFVTQKNISLKSTNSVFIPILVLLLLTRPESFLWVSLFTAILSARKITTNGIAQGLIETAPLFAAIIITVIALTIFRLTYFGYPLPNTYYAKVSPSLSYNLSQGIPYFLKYVFSNSTILLCVLCTALAGIHTILRFAKGKFTDDALLFLPVIAGIGLLTPILTGGDHFSLFRFYQSVYPILLLCLIYYLKSVLPYYIPKKPNRNISQKAQGIFFTGVILILSSYFILDQWNIFINQSPYMLVDFELAKVEREKGQFVQDIFFNLPTLPRIAVIASGGIKYTYSGEIIDLMGLNNLSMAHNNGKRIGLKDHSAFEKITFYQLQPDIVTPNVVNEDWQYKEGDLKNSWVNELGFKGLFNDSNFLELYVYAKISESKPTNNFLVGWFRKSFLDNLDVSDYFIIERLKYTTH